MTLNLASAASIQALRGERRVVLLSAPDASNSKLITQRGILQRWRGAADRDVTVIEIAGELVSGVDDLAADLRTRYHLPNDRFAVLLIGKDGHVALDSAAVLKGSQLEAAIDAMPMRRAGER